jgi:hypothetical protein
MFKWLSDKFRKNAQAPAAPLTPVAAGMPASHVPVAPPEQAQLPSDLMRGLMCFGFDDFFTREQAGEPHQLQAESMKRDNYLHRFFTAAHDIIRYAHIEPRYDSHIETHELTALKPEVADFLATQPKDTAEAFETLFHYCRKYLKSVHDMPLSANGQGKTISVAQNGITNAEAAELQAALDKIWQAVPDVSPYVVEGMEYVMEGATTVAASFKGYRWTDCDRRSDAGIAGKLGEAIAQGYAVPKEDAAIAAQTAANMAALKPHAQDIAEKQLAWCLSRTVDTGDNWDAFGNSRTLAQDILGKLAAGTTVPDMAQAIRNGAYGKPKDDKDADSRKRNAEAMSAVADYLDLAQQVNSGAWFDAQQSRLQDLAEQAALTPAQRAARKAAAEKAERVRLGEEAARGAIVLNSSVSVKPPLQFKHAPKA